MGAQSVPCPEHCALVGEPMRHDISPRDDYTSGIRANAILLARMFSSGLLHPFFTGLDLRREEVQRHIGVHHIMGPGDWLAPVKLTTGKAG